MSFEVKGKLHEIFDEQQVSEKFKKREFVLEIDDNSYTQHIKFQSTQERCNLLDKFKKGDLVNVHFNLSGRPFVNREGNTVYFTNLVAWKIDALSNGSGSGESFEDYMMPDNMPPHDDSDIPF